jgi:GTP-binding protein
VPRPGCIVSAETGTAIAFAIDKLQDRGKFFVDPGEEVYAGQVIGESPKTREELAVNVILRARSSPTCAPAAAMRRPTSRRP